MCRSIHLPSLSRLVAQLSFQESRHTRKCCCSPVNPLMRYAKLERHQTYGVSLCNPSLIFAPTHSQPIAARGPFVMNTQEEIMEAITDYSNGKMG